MVRTSLDTCVSIRSSSVYIPTVPFVSFCVIDLHNVFSESGAGPEIVNVNVLLFAVVFVWCFV